MKVRRLVGLLQSESDDDQQEIRITSGYSAFEILSVYEADGTLWIDIKEVDDESDA